MGGGWAFDGRTMGFFSLLTCLAFDGRTMGFFLFWCVWLSGGGRWAFFSFGVFGFRWADDGLFSLLAGLAFGGWTMGFFRFWCVWLLVGFVCFVTFWPSFSFFEVALCSLSPSIFCVQLPIVKKAKAASIPPIVGPITGIHAYPQSLFPLFLMGKIACIIRGPKSRAGLIA